jgi:hypothetical protein
MMYVGLDLGQAVDYTAVAVLEQTGEPPTAWYAVRWLERWRGVSYPEQVARMAKLLAAAELADCAFIVDQTGVGRAVVDMLKAAGLCPTGISIHGGDAVTHQGDEWRVPKRDLVSTVAVLLQTRRLQIVRSLAHADTLTHELVNFRVTIDPRTAHDSYAAWREGTHDDLVLAVALASWAAEARVGGRAHVWLLGGLDEVDAATGEFRW